MKRGCVLESKEEMHRSVSTNPPQEIGLPDVSRGMNLEYFQFPLTICCKNL